MPVVGSTQGKMPMPTQISGINGASELPVKKESLGYVEGNLRIVESMYVYQFT